MAAINAICTMYKSGDHVVCGHNLYGGVPRLFNQVLTGYGLEFTYVDTSHVNRVESALQKNTKVVFLESPTNPTLDVLAVPPGAIGARLLLCSRYAVTARFFNRLNPSRVRIQTLPSLAASTETTRALHNPSRSVYV